MLKSAGWHVGKLAGRQVGRSTAVAAVGKLASRQFGRSAGRQVGRSASRQFGRSAGPQGGRSAGRQVDRAARERVGRSAGRHVSRSASRQAGRLTSRQAAWYAGCQVDKSLDPLTNPHPRSHQNPSNFTVENFSWKCTHAVQVTYAVCGPRLPARGCSPRSQAGARVVY